MASKVEWILRAKALQARLMELKSTTTIKEVHMQEKTAQALAWEREFWQRDREAQATMAERESGANFRVS